MSEKSYLDVYKASAGSGKTFTLTCAYIGYLLADPSAYRSILAVTFTNRATEEMKVRVLSTLYDIAHGAPPPTPFNPMVETLGKEAFAKRASEVLYNLLHDYSYFRIETIDTFFQRVFRNLARELSLTANLRVELNDNQVVELAVDELIDGLKADDEVLTWLMEYITEHIDADSGWNVIGAVKRFGRHIFKPFYKENGNALQGVRYDEVKRVLRGIRDAARERMSGIAEHFFADLRKNGISVEELWYKEKGPAIYFKKLQMGVFNESILTKRVADVLADSSRWVPSNSEKASLLLERAAALWTPLIAEAESIRAQQYKLYQTAQQTLRHLNQLRLLGDIEKRVNTLNEESNRFLLSNTQYLLSTLIEESDSPFVFEKIGSGLRHIMIDEFQDTSTIQWRNFKILLSECMSQGYKSLIVGDVKQSIYRWRSGDWRLLNNISEEFPPSKHLSIKHLDTNYRSEKKIVAFNNHFFETAVSHEREGLKADNVAGSDAYGHAYNDVSQHLPNWREKRDKGYVHIELFGSEHYREKVLEKVASVVKSLIYEQHFKSNDIAILVRINRDIPTLASYFTEVLPDVKLVSDEAFQLSASPAVNLLINALKVLNNPADELTTATLAKSYQNDVLGMGLSDAELFVSDQTLSAFLPEVFTKNRTKLSSMPLFDLTEKLYSIFDLEKIDGQSAYVSTLYDILSDYVRERTPDLNMFLQEWEGVLSTRTIQSNELDGIRLISIHKSKGLEFKHVIIPFCDWQLEQQETIWCKPDEAPFDLLPVVPINYSSKSLKGTIYEKDCQLEHLQNTVDNMNLLYVAFTRACESLTVFGKRDKKNTRSQTIQEVLANVSEQLGEQATYEDHGNDSNIVFTYGELNMNETEEIGARNTSENIFLKIPTPLKIAIKSFDTSVEFRQSNKSRKFIEDDSEQDEQQEGYIKAGNVLHLIFSEIRTTDDIPRVMERLRREGILYQKELGEEKVKEMLKRIISNPRIADWFSPRWELFNECSIITKDDAGKLVQYRPDRVMSNGHETIIVDFKFGQPREEYKSQVRKYMDLLHQMGYKNISGYLWFVYSNKIEEV